MIIFADSEEQAIDQAIQSLRDENPDLLNYADDLKSVYFKIAQKLVDVGYQGAIEEEQKGIGSDYVSTIEEPSLDQIVIEIQRKSDEYPKLDETILSTALFKRVVRLLISQLLNIGHMKGRDDINNREKLDDRVR
jgi:hypothetical protein